MTRRHFVEIVTVGDEILLGETLDSNAAFLARASARAGLEISRVTTLPDDPERLRAGFREARARRGVVLVSGGLGPTPDDLTRWALADVFARPLELREELLGELHRKFRAFGYSRMPEANLAQARLPAGALPLPNPRGTAVGILLEEEDSVFFAMPGVPSEMEGMFLEQVLPRLRQRAGEELHEVRQRLVRTAALGESALVEKIADLVEAAAPVRVAFLPGNGSVDIRLTVSGMPTAEADRLLTRLEGPLVERLADWIYARGDHTLGESVGRALTARRLSLGVAESCTGGLVSDLITDVPGSSAYYVGGVVAYSNELKQALLGVPGSVLERHGAVSAETCAAMLAGVRSRLGTQCALAITGVAGPGGGTDLKPVGLVHYGVDVAGDIRLEERRWPGSRRDVKLRAARAALLLLLRAVEDGATPPATPPATEDGR